MIDHVGITVSDFNKSKRFYSAALAAVKFKLLHDFPASVTGHTDVAGFGEPPKPEFWIARGTANIPAVYVACRVASASLVDAFYRAAINAGGRDNGAPGIRPEYHPNYYGAFVLDPDGHNIEAVCHESG